MNPYRCVGRIYIYIYIYIHTNMKQNENENTINPMEQNPS